MAMVNSSLVKLCYIAQLSIKNIKKIEGKFFIFSNKYYIII